MTTKRVFPGLSSSTYEHPLDRKALRALKQTAGFDRLVKFILALGVEPIMDYQNRSTFVKCGPEQCKPLYDMYREAAEILDIKPLPPLYLAHSPMVNAWTFGTERPYVVVTSALVEGFSDEEIQCVMGHELGHILAGHCLYRTVGNMLLGVIRLGVSVAGPILGLPAWILSRGLLSAFFYWIRCSELTADRAGLVVTQNPQVSYSTDMKLAGGPGAKISEMLNVDQFLKQAREFEEDPNLNSQLLKFLMQDQKTHPFPVFRARELELWVESGEFESLLAGEYIHRPPEFVAQGLGDFEDEYKTVENGEADQFADRVGPRQKREIEALTRDCLARVFGVHLPPKIPQDALDRAVQDFARIQPGECILAFYDGGLDRSDSLVITTHGLFSGRQPEVRLSWPQLNSFEPSTSGLLRAPALNINDGQLKLSFHRREVRDGFRDLFSRLTEIHVAGK